MTEHLETRAKLKNISDIRDFDHLLEISTLDDTDKEILRLHYLKNKGFAYIADQLGYAEITIKKRHHRALKKLNSIL